MVECLLCKQDVAGPNPAASTSGGAFSAVVSCSLKTEVDDLKRIAT